MSKKIVILSIAVLATLLVFSWIRLLKSNTTSSSTINPSTNTQTTQVSEKDKPQIVSTKPDPLDRTIIPADQIIEITFNRPLENVGEFKAKIEPKTEYKLELSGDRKTGRIIPVKPYELGSDFTLSIGPDTKFDGVGNWGQSKDFHFRTITYKGI